MHSYELGNCLRGFIGGRFETDDEAWDALSAEFNERYPSRGGREVVLSKSIRHGRTTGGNETDSDRKLREGLEAMLQADRYLELATATPDHMTITPPRYRARNGGQ